MTAFKLLVSSQCQYLAVGFAQFETWIFKIEKAKTSLNITKKSILGPRGIKTSVGSHHLSVDLSLGIFVEITSVIYSVIPLSYGIWRKTNQEAGIKFLKILTELGSHSRITYIVNGWAWVTIWRYNCWCL